MKWEYKKSILSYEQENDDIIMLDRLGKEGWELVSVLPQSEFSWKILYLKRPYLDEIAETSVESAHDRTESGCTNFKLSGYDSTDRRCVESKHKHRTQCYIVYDDGVGIPCGKCS